MKQGGVKITAKNLCIWYAFGN